MTVLRRKRSSCASGSGYVPSCSTGFCVAKTVNSSPSGRARRSRGGMLQEAGVALGARAVGAAAALHTAAEAAHQPRGRGAGGANPRVCLRERADVLERRAAFYALFVVHWERARTQCKQQHKACQKSL